MSTRGRKIPKLSLTARSAQIFFSSTVVSCWPCAPIIRNRPVTAQESLRACWKRFRQGLDLPLEVGHLTREGQRMMPTVMQSDSCVAC